MRVFIVLVHVQKINMPSFPLSHIDLQTDAVERVLGLSASSCRGRDASVLAVAHLHVGSTQVHSSAWRIHQKGVRPADGCRARGAGAGRTASITRAALALWAMILESCTPPASKSTCHSTSPCAHVMVTAAPEPQLFRVHLRRLLVGRRVCRAVHWLYL